MTLLSDEFLDGIYGAQSYMQAFVVCSLRRRWQSTRESNALLWSRNRLVAKKDGRVWVVPEEGPPLNREKKPEWPPGWDQHRPVKHESDVLELLGIPYHPPSERNCP